MRDPIDEGFASWLLYWRAKHRLTLLEASQLISLNPFRLRALESGSPNKSVTRRECELISRAYLVSEVAVVAAATGLIRVPDGPSSVDPTQGA